MSKTLRHKPFCCIGRRLVRQFPKEPTTNVFHSLPEHGAIEMERLIEAKKDWQAECARIQKDKTSFDAPKGFEEGARDLFEGVHFRLEGIVTILFGDKIHYTREWGTYDAEKFIDEVIALSRTPGTLYSYRIDAVAYPIDVIYFCYEDGKLVRQIPPEPCEPARPPSRDAYGENGQGEFDADTYNYESNWKYYRSLLMDWEAQCARIKLEGPKYDAPTGFKEGDRDLIKGVNFKEVLGCRKKTECTCSLVAERVVCSQAQPIAIPLFPVKEEGDMRTDAERWEDIADALYGICQLFCNSGDWKDEKKMYEKEKIAATTALLKDDHTHQAS